MASRTPSISSRADIAIAREIDSKYDNVRIVADAIDDVTAVANNLTLLTEISNARLELLGLLDVLGMKEEILALYGISDELVILATEIDMLNSLYADKAKFDSLFADKVILDSLYADKATLDALYANKAQFDIVIASLADIITVSDNIASVANVAGSIGNVNTLVPRLDNVDVVATNIVDVNAVAANVHNTSVVASNITDINTVVTEVVPNMPEILLVDNRAMQVAQDTIDVTNMKDAVYNTFYDFNVRYLGSYNTDPVTSYLGDPLLDGALYFNTVFNTLKVYDKTDGVWITVTAQSNISGMFDVRLTSVTTDDILVWNGTYWVNVASDSLPISTPTQSALDLKADKTVTYTKTEVQTILPKVGFDTTNTVVPGVGQMAWNQDEGTVDLGLMGAVLQIGQEFFIKIRNTSGATIENGTVVMASGSIGNSGRITVVPHDGVQANASRALGVMTHTIANGADGLATIIGKVRGIDTTGSLVGETWVDGNILYVKPVDSGRLTNVEPTDLQMSMKVAMVVKAHTSGTLYVRVNGFDENHYKAWVQTRLDAKVTRPVSTTHKVVKFTGTDGSIGDSNLVSNSMGDLGLNVSPSLWHTSVRALETAAGALFNYAGTKFSLVQNAYQGLDGVFRYKSNAPATLINQENGEIKFSTAPSGVTEASVTFTERMKISNTGELIVNGNTVSTIADANKNVLSATKLTTARTIALTGDVTGSVSFDGSANASMTATIAANSVALGTDTTGNYVAGNTAGTGITISGTAGEGWSPTIAITNVGTAGTYTKVTTNAQGQVTAGTTLSATDIPALDASKITSGIIDAARLPAYVDDVLEFANLAGFPATGETGKIYIALDTNKTYRWSGSVYIYITSGAVDSVAGKTGIVTLVKGDVGLGNVDNTSDASKPVSTAQQTALDLKANIASPTFTGVPAVPTASVGTNTTQVASTAYVVAEINKIEEW